VRVRVRVRVMARVRVRVRVRVRLRLRLRLRLRGTRVGVRGVRAGAGEREQRPSVGAIGERTAQG
jgi:hypothetical protein